RRPVLALDQVRFECEAVAVVAAESEYQAADAADAVLVDLDPVTGDEPAVVDTVHAFGDAAGAFAGAAVTVRERLSMARIAGAARLASRTRTRRPRPTPPAWTWRWRPTRTDACAACAGGSTGRSGPTSPRAA